MPRPATLLFLVVTLATASVGMVCALGPLVAVAITLAQLHPAAGVGTVQGGQAVLRATVTNAGPGTASPVVTVASSSDYDVVALQSSSGFCFFLQSCLLAPLAAGQSADVDLVVQPRGQAADPTPVDVSVGGWYQDSDPSDDSDRFLLPVDPAFLLGISAGPPRASLREGEKTRLSATATYDRGPPRDVTTDVTWTTLNGAIVVVDPNGVVTAQPGASGASAGVQAQLGGQTATVQIDVDDQVTSTLTIACADRDARVPVGGSTACRAQIARRSTALGYSSFTPATALVQWNCIGPAAKCNDAVPRKGVVECLQRGNVTVEATAFGLRALWPLECVDRQVASAVVTPPIVRNAFGAFTCNNLTIINSDGSFDHPAPDQVTAGSLTTGFPISPLGLVVPFVCHRGLNAGADTLSIAFGGTVASVPVDVDPPDPDRKLEIAPRKLLLAPGAEAAVDVSYINKMTRTDAFVAWTVADTAVAQTYLPPPDPAIVQVPISDSGLNHSPAPQLVRGGTPGTTLLTARDVYDAGQVDSIPVVVKAVQALIVEPVVGTAPVVVQRGGARQLRARLVFSDGTERDVSADATWTSSQPIEAPVLDTGGEYIAGNPVRGGGRVLGRELTTAVITADYGDTSAGIQVQVVDVSPTALFVSGQTSLKLGTRGRTFVGAPFDDGSFNDVTDQVLLQSTDPSVLAAGNGANDSGTIYGISPGQVDVFAQFGGTTGSQTVRVHDGTLNGFQVVPAGDMNVGETRFFSPIASFTDGVSFFTQDLGLDAVCTSSDESVLTMSNAPRHECEATAEQPGSADVTAEYTDLDGNTFTAFLPIVVK